MPSAMPDLGGHAWRRIFLPFALGYYLSYLLRTVNAVIAPDLARELELSAADLGLLTSAYLAAFALVQLPLGMALDRFGPRRVEAALLLLCALGCAAFASGHSLGRLLLARGLIGLGVAACLMAAFKAFGVWFGSERQASLNSSIMVAGGLGALTASAPLTALLPLMGWRGIFWGLALLSLAAALFIARMPDKPVSGATESLAEQMRGVAMVLKSRVFWRYVPQTSLMIGGFIAVQGLWAVPWLMGVNGATQAGAALHLLLLNLGLMAGYMVIAATVTRLARLGLTPPRLIGLGNTLALLMSLLLIFEAGPTLLLWPLFGLVYSAANLSYAAHAQGFAKQLAGRANTCLNLGVFIGSFSLQWGFGVVVDGGVAGGMTRAESLQQAWLGMVALQAASLLWFFVARRWAQGAGRA